jgi:hypothetical protein
VNQLASSAISKNDQVEEEGLSVHVEPKPVCLHRGSYLAFRSRRAAGGHIRGTWPGAVSMIVRVSWSVSRSSIYVFRIVAGVAWPKASSVRLTLALLRMNRIGNGAGVQPDRMIPKAQRRAPWEIITLVGLLVTLSNTYPTVKAVNESRDTQAHGVRDLATVSGVHHSTKPLRTSVKVTLARPVGGATTTTVSIPERVSYSDGTRITVLVDSKDPGYAELPGKPLTDGGQLVVREIVDGVFLFAGFVHLARYVKRRRARAQQAAAESQGIFATPAPK